MASDLFDGSGVLSAPYVDYITSSFAKLTQSGGLLVPSWPAESTGFYHGSAATGNNQYSEILIDASLGAGQTYWSATVRTTGNNGTRTYYSITVTSNHWYLAKKVNGTNVWERDGAGTFGAGSLIRIEAIDAGANVTITASDNGVLIDSHTDTSSVLTGGQPGFEVYAHTDFLAGIRSWSGGNVGGGSIPAGAASYNYAQQ